MAKKPTVTTLQSGFNSTETLNANFEALRDGFENTLSLDGSTPNAMEADLDLNGNNLIGATGLLINGTDYLAAVEAAKAAALIAQAAAETAETNAETAETNAESSETAAGLSATAAATSETNASTSATAASVSETAAALSETNASASETAAGLSETAAATSETNAATSATNASTSATAAATSETNASTSETNAATSASAASTSETNAATSESNAAASATAALASQTAAASSESNAAVSATNAATSETNASTSASTASTKATEAATSATNAATSETNAATSEANAASSASSAQASKDAALAALDSFDDRYLGQKASDPTLDNDGDALVAGALYFNTSDDVMKVYEGSSWVAAYASLSGALLATNNLSDLANAATARTNLGLGTSNSPTFAGLTTTADVSFGDNDKAIFGAGSDLQIYHSGSHSYITDTGTGSLYIRGSNFVSIQAADGTNSIVADTDSEVTLYHNGSTKLVTTTTGIDVTGTVTMDGATTSANINFGDNDKAVFGAGSDLQIYHDGNNSWIQDQGTGNLIIRASSGTYIQGVNGENGLAVIENGATTAFFDGVEKLATSSTGIRVTGEVDMDDTLYIESTTGYGNIEIGGPSGAYIDLKAPFSDDYDGRIITTGDGMVLTAGSGHGVTLQYENSTKLATTSTGIDVTGTVTATSYAGDGSALTGIAAGATGGGSDDIFYENGQNVTTNYTITNGKNAMSAGPITINSGVTVTVGAGETWTVV